MYRLCSAAEYWAPPPGNARAFLRLPILICMCLRKKMLHPVFRSCFSVLQLAHKFHLFELCEMSALPSSDGKGRKFSLPALCTSPDAGFLSLPRLNFMRLKSFAGERRISDFVGFSAFEFFEPLLRKITTEGLHRTDFSPQPHPTQRRAPLLPHPARHSAPLLPHPARRRAPPQPHQPDFSKLFFRAPARLRSHSICLGTHCSWLGPILPRSAKRAARAVQTGGRRICRRETRFFHNHLVAIFLHICYNI